MESTESLQNLITTFGQDDKYIQDNQKLFGGIVTATNDYLSQGTSLSSNTTLKTLAAQQLVSIDRILDQAFSHLMGDILSHTLEDQTGQTTADSLKALKPFEEAYSKVKVELLNTNIELRIGSNENITVTAPGPSNNTLSDFPIPLGGIPYYSFSGPDESSTIYANGRVGPILYRVDPTVDEAKKDVEWAIQVFQGRSSDDAGTQQWVNTVANMIVNHQTTEPEVRGWIANNDQTHNAIVHAVVYDIWAGHRPYGIDEWANQLQIDWANGSTATLQDIKNWAAHGSNNILFTYEKEGGNPNERLNGYVPTNSSGLTISYGVDLSRHTESELRQMMGNNDLANSILNKINSANPDLLGKGGGHYGLTGNAARAYAGTIGLTSEESEFIGQKMYEQTTNIVRDNYDKSSQKFNFDDLPAKTRTAIIDLAYPWGPYFGSAGDSARQRVWNDFTNGNWKAAVNDITKAQGNPRTFDDASLIQLDRDQGYLR
ncbi:pesticin C-terminus-like muramidase [Entomobacter blattae]|nr:pesticin C-terminus-like muramidase [Entomobacter blattae]